MAVHHKELTGEDLIELEDQRKDERETRGEEVTEEPKRLTVQERARGFALLEEALLAFQAQDPDVECMVHMKRGRHSVQSTATESSMGRKIKSYYPDMLDHFLKRVDRIESSKEPELCHLCQA